MFLKTALVTLGSGFLATAHAQQLQFKNIRAFGGGSGVPCSYNNDGEDNIDLIQEEETGLVSFLFDTMGVFLPQNGPSNSADLSCNVEARVVIPRGYYVETLGQQIYGGVSKSEGSTGGLSTNAFFFTKQIPLNQINISFDNPARNEPAIVKSNTQYLADTNLKFCAQCIASTAANVFEVDFKFQVLAVGNKSSNDQYLVSTIDGADATVAFTPGLKKCPDVFRLALQCSNSLFGTRIPTPRRRG